MISIVTHTQGKSPWARACIESVALALPENAIHQVIEMKRDYTRERWEALQSADYVGFVDDDDLVEPSAIAACMRALDKTGAGVAFTTQQVIDAAGRPLGLTRPAAVTIDIAMHPQSLHHFALIRRNALDDSALRAALEIGIGIDWLCTANAALKHGAVHVPAVGYRWRMYPTQDSDLKSEQFKAALPALRKVTCSWLSKVTPVPKFVERTR